LPIGCCSRLCSVALPTSQSRTSSSSTVCSRQLRSFCSHIEVQSGCSRGLRAWFLHFGCGGAGWKTGSPISAHRMAPASQWALRCSCSFRRPLSELFARGSMKCCGTFALFEGRKVAWPHCRYFGRFGLPRVWRREAGSAARESYGAVFELPDNVRFPPKADSMGRLLVDTVHAKCRERR